MEKEEAVRRWWRRRKKIKNNKKTNTIAITLNKATVDEERGEGGEEEQGKG